MVGAAEDGAGEPLPWVESSTRPAPTVGAARPRTEPPQAPSRPPLPDDLKPGPESKALLDGLRAVVRDIDLLTSLPDARKAEVLERFKVVRADLVHAHLRNLPVERLKESTEGRLRVGSIPKAGFTTVQDVLDAGSARLQAIPGVGPQTATQIYAAARHVAATVEQTVPVRLDAERRDGRQLELLRSLRRYEDVDRVLAPLTDDLELVRGRARAVLLDGPRPPGRIRWVFLGRTRKEHFRQQVRGIDALARDPQVLQVVWQLRAGLEDLDEATYSPSALWADYEARAPDYYGLLGELADLSLDVATVQGHLPAELAERIAAQQLDLSHLTVSLRGYQAFGAKFALVQRRCIVGDEMGLGKTIEAIAVMGHLAALGATHFLVVCPASVLVNWTREVAARSTLTAHRVHGNERLGAFAAWQKRGGVAVTTYETLRSLPVAESRPALVVVDEAHFVKNPSAARSKATRTWTAGADRVLFLTGTAMENRVDEFRSLVEYLQPAVASSIRAVSGLAGAASFRTAVASVYLRRNQEDVLPELPERLDMLDWVDLTKRDQEAYRHAVASRNFMAMRRAAFRADADSAKVQRLLEIVEESASNGWKVVVFSFFHDVLLSVQAQLTGSVHGPLTGSVPPTARQGMVDGLPRLRDMRCF